MAIHYYDSSGLWIAFRRKPDDRYLFNSHAAWIGWFPWRDADAVTTTGDYLGTIVGDRFLHRHRQPYRGYPGFPGFPGYPGHPAYPGHWGPRSLPAGFADVPLPMLKANSD
ncbi:hypothetical protein [Amycolatopsis magusensis]|uniref:Uncharacterized protein n=1 Tax=Amycolatopsis magusensis TaxID=882444 RepID=A0ABS4PXM4_9PSEU|nr:hypothetical protein [Amycolatopsis magusensis]MBP2183326.1 hypothetical protein [Amycolatopsis magusensis]MDI5975451.1 hypothetical protein [Amycolatopsis magusensis]